MPTVCCVLGCDSTHKTANVFTFPKDGSLRLQWLSSIPMKSSKISKHTLVCSIHFHPDQIIREDILHSDGLPVKRGRCSLKKGAVPTYFPALPNYIPKAVRAPQVESETRRLENVEKIYIQENRCSLIEGTVPINFPALTNYIPKAGRAPRVESETRRLEDVEKIFIQEGHINFFDELSSKLNHLSEYSWNISKQGLKIFFYKIDFKNDFPQINMSFSINADLDAEICIYSNLISNKKLKSILGSELKCDSYSKIKRLMKYLDSVDNDSIITVE